MSAAPRYWAEGASVRSMFMTLTIPEAMFQLRQTRWLAKNDRSTPHAYQKRRADLIAALRCARKTQREIVR